MNDIDQKIQAALRRTETNNDLPPDAGLADELIQVFRGRRIWLNAYAALLTFVFFAGVVWSAFRFTAAETTADQLPWLALGGALLLATGLLKLWFWQEIHTNRILRELKRIELLLASRK